MKLLLLASFALLCTASALYKTKTIAINDEGNFLITTPNGKQVTIARHEGVDGQKNIHITITGPGIHKQIAVHDQTLENVEVAGHHYAPSIFGDEEYRPKRSSSKTQGDILAEILQEYKGVVTETQYEKFLAHINKAVKKGEISPQIYELLEQLDEQQHQVGQEYTQGQTWPIQHGLWQYWQSKVVPQGWQYWQNKVVPQGWQYGQNQVVPQSWQYWQNKVVPQGWQYEQTKVVPQVWQYEQNTVVPQIWQHEQTKVVPQVWQYGQSKVVPQVWQYGQSKVVPQVWQYGQSKVVPQEFDNVVLKQQTVVPQTFWKHQVVPQIVDNALWKQLNLQVHDYEHTVVPQQWSGVHQPIYGQWKSIPVTLQQVLGVPHSVYQQPIYQGLPVHTKTNYNGITYPQVVY